MACNEEIRKAMKEHGISYWKLADALGVCENTIGRKLRHEITGEEKEKILSIIRNYAE